MGVAHPPSHLIPKGQTNRGGVTMVGPRDYLEKRDFRRMDMVECPVALRNLATGETVTGCVRNLSGSGLLVASPQELPLGGKYHLKVTPERSVVPPLDAEAEVVRVKHNGQGYEIGMVITAFGSQT